MRGLILFDWDGTIVDEQNQIHDKQRFQQIIQAKISQGWIIGLNSDTPLRRLRRWRESLSMNGPIVAERGAVAWWPDEQHIVSEKADIFAAFRESLIQRLLQQEEYALFFGDNTEFIKSVNRIAVGDSVIIALDAYRKCSIGMFVRRVVNQELVCDISIAKNIQRLLESTSPSSFLVSAIDFNERICFLCVNDPEVDKSRGVDVLLEKWGKPPHVYMIGDTMADYLNLPEVHQLAVGNAQPDYKEKAERIAVNNFAQGCIELLSKI